MNPVGRKAEGDVDAPIHDQSDASIPCAAPGRGFNFSGELEQGRAFEVAVANLNPIDPARDGGLDGIDRRQRAAAPVDDQTKNRSLSRERGSARDSGQKEAIWSRGLDAEA